MYNNSKIIIFNDIISKIYNVRVRLFNEEESKELYNILSSSNVVDITYIKNHCLKTIEKDNIFYIVLNSEYIIAEFENINDVKNIGFYFIRLMDFIL